MIAQVYTYNATSDPVKTQDGLCKSRHACFAERYFRQFADGEQLLLLQAPAHDLNSNRPPYISLNVE
jgi:hypothetical protein